MSGNLQKNVRCMGYENETFDQVVSAFAKVSSATISIKLGTGVIH
jgi:hypothetical protein